MVGAATHPLPSTAPPDSATLPVIDSRDSPDPLARHGLDRAWLADALAAAGVADGAELTGVDPTVIGTGQVGENLRCRLRWSGPGAATAPPSVVVKVPSTNELSRSAAAATRTYIREVGFYRDLRPRVAIRTPAPYHVSEDRGANSFRLVLEDLTPARSGDQLAGCSLAQAAVAVDAAADLHGSTWDQRDLLDLEWLDEPTPESRRLRDELYAAVLPGFIERFTGVLSGAELDIGRWLGPVMSSGTGDALLPQCVTHGDFRLDNMLFGPGPADLATVDWQTLTFSQGPGDLAYFLGTSLAPEVRRKGEKALLQRYRDRLAHHGVEIGPEILWQAYRAGAPSGFVMAVIASQIVERTDRGDRMFAAMARGSARLMADLDLGPSRPT